MPSPGEMRPAEFRVEGRDLLWDQFYAPVGRIVMAIADWLNAFQFLTVRRYLTLVFWTLVVLLGLLAIWTP